MPETFKGTIFLLALVMSASLMPVEKLPLASWQTALGLGFVSAVFDNIPLTALALEQGGYDWGFLAYAVGFGGSMIWFGSSAGVALASMFPEAKSVGLWLRHGWHVAVAYVIGFFVMLAVIGWHPDPPAPQARRHPAPAATTVRDGRRVGRNRRQPYCADRDPRNGANTPTPACTRHHRAQRLGAQGTPGASSRHHRTRVSS